VQGNVGAQAHRELTDNSTKSHSHGTGNSPVSPVAKSCAYPMQSRLFDLPKKEDEEWKRVPCAPSYWVSSAGRVYSEPTTGNGVGNDPGGLLSWSEQSSGYPTVLLTTDEGPKRKLVHRLVMKAHGPPPPTDRHTLVNHIDCDKTNPHISNLEWVTPLENNVHGMLMEMINLNGEGETMARVERWIEANRG